ncbi:MAG: hypothetical protein JJU05_06865 [Verrucomicrobia bacterium]|nr:hypothetical protein [Verrucomicrobiota bacterium]MCH8527031.1 hypothetical protein [Kiritimatiellia bacterium]
MKRIWMLIALGLLTVIAEDKPVHTLDATLSLGRVEFGASPQALQAAGIKMRRLEQSPDQRMERWAMENVNDLELDLQLEAELGFIDGMLFRLFLRPGDVESGAFLQRLARRFQAGDEMQESQVFQIHYQEEGFMEPAGFSIHARPLLLLVEGWREESRGEFEAFEHFRRQ